MNAPPQVETPGRGSGAGVGGIQQQSRAEHSNVAPRGQRLPAYGCGYWRLIVVTRSGKRSVHTRYPDRAAACRARDKFASGWAALQATLAVEPPCRLIPFRQRAPKAA